MNRFFRGRMIKPTPYIIYCLFILGVLGGMVAMLIVSSTSWSADLWTAVLGIFIPVVVLMVGVGSFMLEGEENGEK